MGAPWPDYDENVPEHRLLRDYLAMDIQNAPNAVAALLVEVRAARSDPGHHHRRDGNAYSLEISGGRAEIECDYDDGLGRLEIPLDLLERALENWP